jgi:hypothetical protein
MAGVQSQGHSGIPCEFDPRKGRDFYVHAFGGQAHDWTGLNTDDLLHARGPHPCVIIEDFLFVTFPHGKPREVSKLRDIHGARHGFAVPRDRFAEAMENLQRHGIEFEGPVTHPEHGPLGESIYFADSIGNHFEICWRRDEDREYDPVMVGAD